MNFLKIFRHGTRTILATYETDPYKNESYWQPEGIGQLQNVKLFKIINLSSHKKIFFFFFSFQTGKRMQYELGQYFRHYYEKLIGPDYSPSKVYYRSSNTSRTVMSAQFNAAGLFNLSFADQMRNGNITDWQPIPIHTVPLNDDYLVYQSIPCAKSDKQHADYMQSPVAMSEFQKHSDLVKSLEENSGWKIPTIEDFHLLTEALIIEHERGLP